MKLLTDFYSISTPKRILLGIISSVIVAYACSFLLSNIGALITGKSYNEFMEYTEDAVKNVHSPGYIMYLLFMQSLSIFFLPAVIMTKTLQVKVIKYWNLHSFPSGYFTFIVLQIIILNIPGMNLWSYLNMKFVSNFIENTSIFSQMYYHNEKLTHFLLLENNFWILCLNMFFMAVIPAISEEFFFRGMLQRYTIKIFKKPGLGIILTAVIFSLMHGDIYNFIPRFCMGLIFGYIFEYTQNLWAPILAHFTHNSIVVLIFYLIQNKIVSPEFEMLGKYGDGLIFGISSVFVVAIAMTLLINNQSHINFSKDKDVDED